MGWIETIPDDAVAAIGCLAALGICLLMPCIAYHVRRRRSEHAQTGRSANSPVFKTAHDAPAAGPS